VNVLVWVLLALLLVISLVLLVISLVMVYFAALNAGARRGMRAFALIVEDESPAARAWLKELRGRCDSDLKVAERMMKP